MASTDALIERLTSILDDQAQRIETKLKASAEPMTTFEMRAMTDAMHALVAVKKVAKDEAVDPEIIELLELAKTLDSYGMTPREAAVLIRHKLEDDRKAGTS